MNDHQSYESPSADRDLSETLMGLRTSEIRNDADFRRAQLQLAEIDAKMAAIENHIADMGTDALERFKAAIEAELMDRSLDTPEGREWVAANSPQEGTA